jgi:uncharacterized membrane protein
MISQSETKVAAALGVNGMAYYWDQYFNPILQGILLIFTIVAMFMLILNRWQDWRIKRNQLREADAAAK